MAKRSIHPCSRLPYCAKATCYPRSAKKTCKLPARRMSISWGDLAMRFATATSVGAMSLGNLASCSVGQGGHLGSCSALQSFARGPERIEEQGAPCDREHGRPRLRGLAAPRGCGTVAPRDDAVALDGPGNEAWEAPGDAHVVAGAPGVAGCGQS